MMTKHRFGYDMNDGITYYYPMPSPSLHSGLLTDAVLHKPFAPVMQLHCIVPLDLRPIIPGHTLSASRRHPITKSALRKLDNLKNAAGANGYLLTLQGLELLIVFIGRLVLTSRKIQNGMLGIDS